MKNREIKFRAWDTFHKKMILVSMSDYNTGDVFDNERFIPMQYTGLKDKQGKEIYEGDIVNDFGGGLWEQCENIKCKEHNINGLHMKEPEDRTRLGVIQFAEGYFGVKTDAMDYVYIPTPNGSSQGWEVIGNIYETPHLLTTPDTAADVSS